MVHIPGGSASYQVPAGDAQGRGWLVYGTSGHDVVHDGSGRDCILGLGGNDNILGSDDDLLFGGPGDDALFGGPATYIDGGDGDDNCNPTGVNCERGGGGNPITLTATGHHSLPTIKLEWTALDRARSYNIYRWTAPAAEYSLLASTTNLLYSDVGVGEDRVYAYYVTAVFAAAPGFESPPSNVITASVPSLTPTPTAVPSATPTPAPAATATPTSPPATATPTATRPPATPTATATPTTAAPTPAISR